MVRTQTDRRHALVTGASRGLGAALAVAVAEAGCDVTLSYRSERAGAERAADAVRAIGGRAAVLQADLADPAQAAALASLAREALGPVDVLVNNAGVGKPVSVADATLDDFDATFAANVRSAFVLTQAVVGEMRERGWGRLVFLSSLAAVTGGGISTAYASSKAALVGMMHSYAAALRDHGVTANAIAPAMVETDMVAGMTGPPPSERMPMGRLGRPEEVGQVARLLIGCAYMTGQTVHLNAGRHMT